MSYKTVSPLAGNQGAKNSATAPTAVAKPTAFEQWKAQQQRRYQAARYLEPLATGYRDPLATRTDGGA